MSEYFARLPYFNPMPLIYSVSLLTMLPNDQKLSSEVLQETPQYRLSAYFKPRDQLILFLTTFRPNKHFQQIIQQSTMPQPMQRIFGSLSKLHDLLSDPKSTEIIKDAGKIKVKVPILKEGEKASTKIITLTLSEMREDLSKVLGSINDLKSKIGAFRYPQDKAKMTNPPEKLLEKQHPQKNGESMENIKQILSDMVKKEVSKMKEEMKEQLTQVMNKIYEENEREWERMIGFLLNNFGTILDQSKKNYQIFTLRSSQNLGDSSNLTSSDMKNSKSNKQSLMPKAIHSEGQNQVNLDQSNCQSVTLGVKMRKNTHDLTLQHQEQKQDNPFLKQNLRKSTDRNFKSEIILPHPPKDEQTIFKRQKQSHHESSDIYYDSSSLLGQNKGQSQPEENSPDEDHDRIQNKFRKLFQQGNLASEPHSQLHENDLLQSSSQSSSSQSSVSADEQENVLESGKWKIKGITKKKLKKDSILESKKSSIEEKKKDDSNLFLYEKEAGEEKPVKKKPWNKSDKSLNRMGRKG